MSTLFPELMAKLAASMEEINRAASRVGAKEGLNPLNPGSTQGTAGYLRHKTKILAAGKPGPLRQKLLMLRKGFLDGVQEGSGGEIQVPPTKVMKHWGDALTGKPFSPKAAEGLRSAIVLHEGFERKAMGRPKFTDSTTLTHANKGILLREHNLVNTLTGEGSEDVQRAMRNMRRMGGENLELRSQLLRVAGGDKRVLQYLEPGQKIPKALRRRIEHRKPGVWEAPAAFARRYVGQRYLGKAQAAALLAGTASAKTREHGPAALEAVKSKTPQLTSAMKARLVRLMAR